jgi:hypothetical protein
LQYSDFLFVVTLKQQLNVLFPLQKSAFRDKRPLLSPKRAEKKGALKAAIAKLADRMGSWLLAFGEGLHAVLLPPPDTFETASIQAASPQNLPFAATLPCYEQSHFRRQGIYDVRQKAAKHRR